MKDNQTKWPQRFFNFIDDHISLPRGIWALQIMHLLFCHIFSNNNLHSDGTCHYSWMRLTHRRSLPEWYDTPQYTHLDYPPLAGYLHYLLGFVAKKFDPHHFANTDEVERYEYTPWAKAGLRFCVFLTNTLTFNVCLIYVVLDYYKERKTSFKLSVIFLFQFFTYYAPIDFGDCQINGLHYSLFLLALLQMIRHNFAWATFLLTMSSLYKQNGLVFVFPFGMYIIYHTYKHASEAYVSV